MKKSLVSVMIAVLAIFVVAGAAWSSLRYYDTDQFEEGNFYTMTLRLQKSGSYMAVAAASQGKVDFDLTAIDPDGNEVVTSDLTDDNTDWIRFTADKEGNYKIKITAYKGSGWYELMVLDVDHY